MLHTYRKTALIEAEQFDGSDEMIKKYHLIQCRGMSDEAPKVYFFGNGYIAKGDMMIFATSDDDELYPLTPMSEEEFQQTYERCD